MLLTPKHLPRLAAIVGLFTQYGLRDVATQQGLLALLADEEEVVVKVQRPHIRAQLADDLVFFHERVDVPQLPALVVALQKVANRVFSGLVLAGLLIASAQLLPYWRALGTAGFVIASMPAVYMVLTIVVSDRANARERQG